jgi:NodT family efflux transporter outer membrane factor (OMF) lipoprotein
MRLRRLSLPLVLLVAACASNEPVREARTTLAPAFTAQSVAQATAPLERWWLAYNDPQLTGLIEQGLASAPDAAIATARIAEARATRSANRFSAWPQGALAANASTTDSRQVAGDVNPFSVEGRTESYTANFDVSWEIDLFGRTRAANRAVDADFAATVFNAEGARTSLAANIADSLFAARGLAAQAVSAREQARIARSTLEMTRLRAQRGIAATADTQRIEADVAQADATLVAAEADLAAARRSLLVLLGRGAEPVEALPIDPAPIAVPGVPASVPGELLRRRPDVREAEERLVLATNLLRVDRLALYPKLTLLPGIGLRRNDGPGVDFGPSGPVTVPQTTTFANWTLGVGLSVPVLDRPRLLAEARASGFRAEQAVLAYEKAVQTAFGEADNALVLLAADRRRVDLLTAGEAQALASYEAARRRYDLGLDDLTTLLSAEQAWRNARTASIAARTQALRRSVQAYKALGGGWTAEAPSTRAPNP